MNDINNFSPENESSFKVKKEDFLSLQKENNPKDEKLNPVKQTTPQPPKTETPIAQAQPNTTAQSIPKNNFFKTPTFNLPKIDDLKSKAQNVNKNTIVFALQIAALIIGLLFVSYFIVNYQAISKRLSYWYNVDIKKQDWKQLNPVTLQKAQTTAQKLDENYLYIPTVGIQSKINWGIEQQDVKNMLGFGVVHYLASAFPDDATGNVYIYGNTTSPIWDASASKTAFTLLDKVQNDNVITIIYKNKIYSYRVFEKSNEKPVIAPGETTESILNLIAKYPVGLNYNTLTIKAKLYKIQSNLSDSIDDKIEKLPENFSSDQLDPITVTPNKNKVEIPSNTRLPNNELTPDRFLPNI